MFIKLKKRYNSFEDWFDIRFGWFFTNGNKTDRREKMLYEKFNIKKDPTLND